MKIALLGYGVEGESAYKYYSRTQPDAQFVIYDNAEAPKYEIPNGVEFVGGVTDFHNIDADIVVKTPAIAPDKVSSTGKITSVTREFFDMCPAPIIGVTGTKGKGTTCTLIYEILKAAGKKVFLVGNIGKPSLDIIQELTTDSIVVYELSSFQLWDLEKSPHIAIVLLVEADHLNVHKSMDEYTEAKANIAKYQRPSDLIIYHPTNEISAKIATYSQGTKLHYNTPEGAFVHDDIIEISNQKICSINEVGLLGVHNLENICAAVTAAWHYTQDVEVVAKVIKEFKGLPHHTEKVHEVNGVSFYDDSFSSAPSATIAAIKSFKDPEIVIIGGAEKNADFTDLVNAIAATENIRKIILIGETAPRIQALLESAGEKRFEVDSTNDFPSIVSRAKEIAQPGDVVLLSPGCASFGMFNNFYERGDQFQALVKNI